MEGHFKQLFPTDHSQQKMEASENNGYAEFRRHTNEINLIDIPFLPEAPPKQNHKK